MKKIFYFILAIITWFIFINIVGYFSNNISAVPYEFQDEIFISSVVGMTIVFLITKAYYKTIKKEQRE